MTKRISHKTSSGDHATGELPSSRPATIKQRSGFPGTGTGYAHAYNQLQIEPPVPDQKISIVPSDNQMEHEADSIANSIVNSPDNPEKLYGNINGSLHAIQINDSRYRQDEKILHCKSAEKSPAPVQQEIATVLPPVQVPDQKLREQAGRGVEMDSKTGAFMAQRFGTDFQNVRIHTDGEAVTLSRSLHARAFSLGRDLYFNEGEYNPGSREGRWLLAHELTHTLQGAHTVQRKPMPTDRFGRPLGFFETPEQEKYDQDTAAIREHLLEILRNQYPATKNNEYLRKLIDEKFTAGSDEHWLATNLLQFGPETLWPAALYAQLQNKSLKNQWSAAKGTLGTTAAGQAIDSFYFPGQTDNRALIIGGVHGSELSGTEVIEILVQRLQKGPKPYYTVIIVPSLFPDNAATAKAKPDTIETGENVGRYTKGTESGSHSTDPNRQFPAFGKGLDPANKKDAKGRDIEPENILLLELIDRFKPARIASVHSNHDLEKAGIYADPRTDSTSKAIGYSSDEALALAMANEANSKGANVPGNKLTGGTASNAIYPLDPAAADKGKQQKRETGKGNSLGGWGSTAVCDKTTPAANRPAMRIITVEVQFARRTQDVAAAEEAKRRTELEAHATALQDIFLGPNQVETLEDPCLMVPKT